MSAGPSKPVDADKSSPSGDSQAAAKPDRFKLTGLIDALPSDSENDSDREPNVLPQFTLEAVAHYIKEGKASNIVVMSGAGVSTAAGIPDFRSPTTGLYSKLASHGIADPQALFDIRTFVDDPKPFFAISRDLFPRDIRPTTSHYFQKLLLDKGVLLRVFTQNIDTLERLAGLEDDAVVYAHGSTTSSTCMGCKAKYDYEWMRDKLHNTEGVPMCDKQDCDAVVKPDVVFFGESLPPRFFNQMKWDMPSCDLLLIMGTSLVVSPFSTLTDCVGKRVPRVLLNREAVGQRSDLMRQIGVPGLDFELPTNYRDVYHGGTTDAACERLAALLGWTDALTTVIADGNRRLDEQGSANM